MNSVQGLASTISGGDSNKINHVEADHNFIGGGMGNVENNPSYGVIAGGWHNLLDTNAWASAIAGGVSNKIRVWGSFLGSGRRNTIELRSDASVLGGGEDNTISAPHAFLGGGRNHLLDISSQFGVIGGGDDNSVDQKFGLIGGGCENIVSTGLWGTIVAGCSNHIFDSLSFIGAGSHNLIDGPDGTIGGGRTNSINRLPGNATKATFGTIAGGNNNFIGPIQPWHATVGTGYNLPWAASISGGFQDTASGHFSSVGGGFWNNAVGLFSSTPGGTGLLAFDFQTVVGRFNANIAAPSGLLNLTGVKLATPARTAIGTLANEATLLAPDAPIFIVGNGGLELDPKLNPVPKRSNAFEVSDNGHSTVFDQLGNTPTRQAVFGGTYSDNIIYAWGDIPTGPIGVITPNSNYGVSTVTHPTAGVFIITITNKNPDGAGLRTFSDASITVTVQDNTPAAESSAACGYATSSRIGVGGFNAFIVRTYNGGSSGCDPQDKPFFFKVTGR